MSGPIIQHELETINHIENKSEFMNITSWNDLKIKEIYWF